MYKVGDIVAGTDTDWRRDITGAGFVGKVTEVHHDKVIAELIKISDAYQGSNEKTFVGRQYAVKKTYIKLIKRGDDVMLRAGMVVRGAVTGLRVVNEKGIFAVLDIAGDDIYVECIEHSDRADRIGMKTWVKIDRLNLATASADTASFIASTATTTGGMNMRLTAGMIVRGTRNTNAVVNEKAVAKVIEVITAGAGATASDKVRVEVIQHDVYSTKVGKKYKVDMSDVVEVANVRVGDMCTGVDGNGNVTVVAGTTARVVEMVGRNHVRVEVVTCANASKIGKKIKTRKIDVTKITATPVPARTAMPVPTRPAPARVSSAPVISSAFNVGDRVTGKVGNGYTITSHKALMEVVRVLSSSTMTVKVLSTTDRRYKDSQIGNYHTVSTLGFTLVPTEPAFVKAFNVGAMVTATEDSGHTTFINGTVGKVIGYTDDNRVRVEITAHPVSAKIGKKMKITQDSLITYVPPVHSFKVGDKVTGAHDRNAVINTYCTAEVIEILPLEKVRVVITDHKVAESKIGKKFKVDALDLKIKEDDVMFNIDDLVTGKAGQGHTVLVPGALGRVVGMHGTKVRVAMMNPETLEDLNRVMRVTPDSIEHVVLCDCDCDCAPVDFDTCYDEADRVANHVLDFIKLATKLDSKVKAYGHLKDAEYLLIGTVPAIYDYDGTLAKILEAQTAFKANEYPKAVRIATYVVKRLTTKF